MKLILIEMIYIEEEWNFFKKKLQKVLPFNNSLKKIQIQNKNNDCLL